MNKRPALFARVQRRDWPRVTWRSSKTASDTGGLRNPWVCAANATRSPK
jgi:hypothetical protein